VARVLYVYAERLAARAGEGRKDPLAPDETWGVDGEAWRGDGALIPVRRLLDVFEMI
jgi:hypothetical protein